MPHLTGSDELFRLIHSLNTEEKGYFRKFALRHTSEGNDYLKLFDAINKQAAFEDAILKKTFRNYARKKMYLKDILIECLLVYHRKSHPHIELLGQLQKIHLMTIKGLYDEAFKLMDKAISKCRQMELFAVLSYLLQMNLELRLTTFSKTQDLVRLEKDYALQSGENWNAETNLRTNSHFSLKLLLEVKRGASDISPDMNLFLGALEPFPAISMRSKIKKLNALFYQGFLQNDLKKRYEMTRQQVVLVRQFKSKHDGSFNIVPVLCNHIVNCIELKKFAEAETLCNKMMESEAKMKLYYDLAFTWGNLYKWTLYFHTAQFEKGLLEIAKTQAEMHRLYESISDEMRLRGASVYDKIKIVLLFCNGDYKECWLFIHDSLSTLKQDESATADVQMMLMLVQLELGNIDMLRSMAIKAEKKLRVKKINNEIYSALVRFFKQVSANNMNKQAFEAWNSLKNIDGTETSSAHAAFGLLKYVYWLETKFSGRAIKDLIKTELKREKLHIQGDALIAP